MNRINWPVAIRAILAGLSVGILAWMGATAALPDGTVVETVGGGVGGLAGFAAAAGAVWRAVRPIVTADPDGDGIPAIVDRDQSAP